MAVHLWRNDPDLPFFRVDPDKGKAVLEGYYDAGSIYMNGEAAICRDFLRWVSPDYHQLRAPDQRKKVGHRIMGIYIPAIDERNWHYKLARVTITVRIKVTPGLCFHSSRKLFKEY